MSQAQNKIDWIHSERKRTRAKRNNIMADTTTTYIEAEYIASERFKWPKNIDIKGEGITYYVKWGCLNIFKGDELIAEIKAKYPANECDSTYKRPNSTDVIEDDDESDDEGEDNE